MRSVVRTAALVSIVLTACADTEPRTQNEPSEAAPSTASADSAATGHAAAGEQAAPVVAEVTLDNATRIAVDVREWRVRMPSDTLKSADYAFVIENHGERPHTIEVRADHGGRWRSIAIAPGASVTLSMNLPPGQYEIVSTDTANVARGMRATFVVIEP